MASIGKKILSAFMEVTDEPALSKLPEVNHQGSVTASPAAGVPAATDDRFSKYFNKLFEEANLPGPDYYEFSKMIDAMKMIPDEKARYTVAFAGLQVQGLNRDKLLDTAGAYLQVLDKDAGNFLSTVDRAIQEKIYGKKNEIEVKMQRMQELSQEISDLQKQITVADTEVKESEEKIAQNTGAYKANLERSKSRILQDIEKIKTFIQ